MILTSLMAQTTFAAIPLSVEVQGARHEIATTLTPETCEDQLTGYFASLAELTPDQVDLDDVQRHGADTVEALFAARVDAQEQIQAFYDAGMLTPGCVSALRRADLASRYLGDHLLEALSADDRPGAWLTTQGDASFPEALRTGDVLVARGVALSSAGIAHMGRVDSQFSHNALVYRDDMGRAWTVEAYLETGAIVQPLEDFLAHDQGRLVVMRHRDADLAARAAAAAYARIADGKTIHYDGAFDIDDSQTLFCSEIPRWAFGPLIGEPATIPYDLTVFPVSETPQLFEAMSLEVGVTSAPADILYDPRFDVVAEWRDVDALGTMRRHDAVVESLFQWMEDQSYTLDPVFGDRAYVGVGRTLRHTPVLGATLRKTLSVGLDRDFLVASLTLQNAAIDLDTALAEILDGDGETRDQLLAELERIRQADLAVWKDRPRRSVFHRRIHPAG